MESPAVVRPEGGESSSLLRGPPRTIMALPDEMLLLVFSCLPSRDLLLGVRPVCRRWRHLVLDPSLWADRSSKEMKELYGYNGPLVLRLALHLAPCLRQLTIDCGPKPLAAASRSRCAAAELDLRWIKKGDVNLARRVLERQIQLGRLRTVSLDFEGVQQRVVARLIRVALGADLTEINVYVASLSCSGGLSDDFPKCRSLKKLGYICEDYKVDPVVERLIELHADTLEAVEVFNVFSHRVIELLAECPGLRALVLVDHRLDELYETCIRSGLLTRLTELHLSLKHEDTRPLLPYFRTATHLTKLRLDGWYGAFLMISVMDCLAALSSSGRSRLSLLDLTHFESPAVALARLPVVLRGLPLLHTLKLFDWPPREALAAITPGVAPCLRLLMISDPVLFCEGAECEQVHMLRLVELNPLLHLLYGVPVHKACAEGSAECPCCKAGLHPPCTTYFIDVCLFAHGPSDECGWPEHNLHRPHVEKLSLSDSSVVFQRQRDYQWRFSECI